MLQDDDMVVFPRVSQVQICQSIIQLICQNQVTCGFKTTKSACTEPLKELLDANKKATLPADVSLVQPRPF